MRKKPVTRDEVRIEGAGSAYAHITTLPRNTARERGNKLEAIPKLWAPLLQELNRVAKEWSESPRGLEHRKWCLEQGYSDPLEPITMPEPSRYAGCPQCRHCGRRFYRAREGNRPQWRLRTGHYCSDRCQRLANAPARKARRAAWVKTRSEQRADARADLECGYCGKPIEAQRSTMRFCSARCRVAAHRQRARSASPRKSR
jgi:predicted nucleic acid-binding Zn ribbon protein